MTPEQFDHWRDFALRMAHTCFANCRRPTPAWVIESVTECLDRLEDESDDIVDWDASPVYVCDRVSDFLWELKPEFRWRFRSEGTAEEDEDERCRKADDQWDEQFGGPVLCCIRAGLDVASAPSAGVVGFTVGDLRDMYPEGVPLWLSEAFTDAFGVSIATLSDGEQICL